MKKLLTISLLALTCVATQAQKQKGETVRIKGYVIASPLPAPTIDEKSKLETIEWPSTENNSWHENAGVLDNVPAVEDTTSIFGRSFQSNFFLPITWSLTDKGKNTILHCYLWMKSDIVTNLWLGNAETTILDKETGIIYQAKATLPEKCYNKVFSVKGKKNTVLDLQIIFPRLPENAKDLTIYGVPNWYMRGTDVYPNTTDFIDETTQPTYDSIPNIHLATKLKDSENYNKDNHETWAVYNDAHTIKPVKENTMALWRTKDATYLAIATEQNWIREYYGRGGDNILLDNQGHQYKCKGVMGYPNQDLFWLEGFPGDYFAIVLIFEPLPLHVDTFTFVQPEGEPFEMWGANWDGEVISGLEVDKLRDNQKLFEYRPRTVVK